jgi:ribosome recycling factor
MDREQSEYSMSFNHLGRLNLILYLCDESSLSLNVDQWNHSLRVLFREITTEMKTEEITKFKTDFEEVNKLLQQHNQNMTSKVKASIHPKLYTLLEDIEIKLRMVLKDSGLLMKMKMDARKAIENL